MFIDQNSNLAAVQKSSYLLSCLRGDAKSAVSGLSLTGDSYAEAVRILKGGYGNVAEVKMEHFNRLHTLKNVSIKNLRRFMMTS